MKIITTLLLVGGLVFLHGCSLQHQVDSLPPMPAAEPSVDDTALSNGMDEPAPQNTPATEGHPRDLWERLRRGYGLDLASLENDRIRVQRDWYARHPEYFKRVTTRAERYLHYIVEEAEKREMPLELALLPIVESAFDPFAYSHGRAAGPWQFIPSTGDYFGLKRTWWADNRRDILKSTQAALRYLDKLAKRFDGDWLLALASYNAGGGTVSRAIRRNEAAGLPTDFWHLKLPRETTAYVPKLLAVAQIVGEPEKYDVALHPIPDAPYFAKVDTHGQIDLNQAAKLADISIEELYLLNPAYNRWATSPDGPHRLLLPKAQAPRFRKRIASLPDDERMRWKRYRIQPGDNLSAIAKRHRTTTAALRSINKLKGNTIIAGRTLLIPGPTAGNDAYSQQLASRLGRQQSSNTKSTRISYKVRGGDTLWAIAKRHGVKVSSLAKWNDMSPNDRLSIGQKLTIQTQSKSDSRDLVRKVRYAVRSGDSLYAIADRFNVSINDIRSWNSSVNKKRYLQPGQRLTLYVDIRNAP